MAAGAAHHHQEHVSSATVSTGRSLIITSVIFSRYVNSTVSGSGSAGGPVLTRTR